MEGRRTLKRRREGGEDPELAPFKGFLGERGVGGTPCASLLLVLVVFEIIPALSRIEEYVRACWESLARFFPGFVRETIVRLANQGLAQERLAEAFCQMNDVMLLVHSLHSGAPAKIYGKGRKLLEAAEFNGAFVALNTTNTTNEPPQKKPARVSWASLMLKKRDPKIIYTDGTNTIDLLPKITKKPARALWASRMLKKWDWKMVTNDDSSNHHSPKPSRPDEANNYNSPIASPTNLSPPTSPSSSSTNTSTHSPSNCPYSFRHPRREALTTRHRPQEFRATNFSTLPPELAAELATPLTPPYTVHNNLVYCQLPGCARRANPFATVAAWKVHVHRAACHNTNTFCTWCGNNVAVPRDLTPEQLTIRMHSHRQERCVAAPRNIIGARRQSIKRLRELGRDTSYFAVPGDTATVQPATGVGKRRRTI